MVLTDQHVSTRLSLHSCRVMMNSFVHILILFGQSFGLFRMSKNRNWKKQKTEIGQLSSRDRAALGQEPRGDWACFPERQNGFKQPKTASESTGESQCLLRHSSRACRICWACWRALGGRRWGTRCRPSILKLHPLSAIGLFEIEIQFSERAFETKDFDEKPWPRLGGVLFDNDIYLFRNSLVLKHPVL
mgnify:CR=1 FL=1